MVAPVRNGFVANRRNPSLNVRSFGQLIRKVSAKPLPLVQIRRKYV